MTIFYENNLNHWLGGKHRFEGDLLFTTYSIETLMFVLLN